MSAHAAPILELLQGIVATSRALADVATMTAAEHAALLPLMDDGARLIAYRAAAVADLLQSGPPKADALAELLPAGACEALRAMAQKGGAA